MPVEPIRYSRIVCAAVVLLGEACWGQQASAPAVTEYALPLARSSPNVIAAGPDGNVWFAQEFNDQIGKISPGGIITEYSVPSPGANNAYYMTAGADGKIWFSEAGSFKIASVTTTGMFTEYSLPPQHGGAWGITVGPDGNIWFTEGEYVGTIDSTGKITEFPIPQSGPPYDPLQLQCIVTGSDGNLWFTEHGVNKVGRITTSGVVTQFSLPVVNSGPACITLGPDGNLWFTEARGAIGQITAAGAITEYPASVSEFGMIARGPDGALWFPEFSNKIGRMTIDGAATDYPIATLSQLYGIAAGPDGNIWFTDPSNNRIGKIVLSNPLPSGPVTLSQTSFTFNAPYQGAPPASQTFTVSAASPTSFTATLDSGLALAAPYLTIAPSGVLSTDQAITVAVEQSSTGGSLLPGAYTGSISIVGGGVTQKTQVTLNVTPTTGGDIYTNAGSVHLNCTIGSIDACRMELDIISKSTSIQNNSFTISTSVATPSGGNWLFLASDDGTVIPSGSTEVTNCALDVSVKTNGLAPGLYQGTVTIAPAGGTVVTIPVSVTLVGANTPAPVVQAVVNAATSAKGPVAPGEIITIYGTGLGPDAPLGTALDAMGKVATSRGGTLVLIGGTPAPLLYVSSTQINCVVPYEVDGKPTLTIQASYLGIGSNSYQIAGAPTDPGVVTANGSGTGPGAILNGDSSINGPNNPAAAGSTVVIFLTGEGETKPTGVTGAVTVVNSAPSGPLTPQPINEPVVTIGGQAAQVSFYGEAPGMVSGVLQINAIVPSGLPGGDMALLVSIAGADSQPGVTVSVR